MLEQVPWGGATTSGGLHEHYLPTEKSEDCAVFTKPITLLLKRMMMFQHLLLLGNLCQILPTPP